MPTLLRTLRAIAQLAILVTVCHSTLLAQATQTVAPPTARNAAGNLPERLSDAEFWKLVTDISEPGGYFRMADNFVSNERDIGTIAGMITTNGPHGGVYMGVGPEQNLTYIAAVKPKMVFIVDIRRQAMLHHLLYKAIFELSRDRIDFITQLFALPRVAGIDSASTIVQMWERLAALPRDTAIFAINLARFRDHLTKTHGFTLTPEELGGLDHVYSSFATYGPWITTNGPGRGGAFVMGNTGGSVAMARGNGGWMAAGSTGGANFITLTSVTDPMGNFNSFLGSEESFRFIKDLHERNLFVPNSGNFGGPRAIRAVGEYVKSRGAIVTSFYVSNVEQYLFQDGIADEFYANVATLPVDERSVFIRPGGFRSNAALCPIEAFLRAVAASRVVSYPNANQCAA